jgi:hypothetical protein
MGFNSLSLKKKRRIAVKGLVFAFEVLGSDFLDICGEVVSMRESLELKYLSSFLSG